MSHMAPYNPPIAHYSEMDVSDVSTEDMYSFMGRGGRRFYYLTRLLNLQYLWYRPEKKCLELWGPFYTHENQQSAHVIRAELDHFLTTSAHEDDDRRPSSPRVPDEASTYVMV